MAGAALAASSIIGFIGSGISAWGSIEAGKNAQLAADFESEQLLRLVPRVRAIAQRQAIEQWRMGRRVQGAARAAAGASGAGVDDVTVDNIMADIAGEAEYRAQVALFEGDEQAHGLKLKALQARTAGKQARASGIADSAATMLSFAGSTAASMAGKYGGGDSNATGGMTLDGITTSPYQDVQLSTPVPSGFWS